MRMSCLLGVLIFSFSVSSAQAQVFENLDNDLIEIQRQQDEILHELRQQEWRELQRQREQSLAIQRLQRRQRLQPCNDSSLADISDALNLAVDAQISYGEAKRRLSCR